MKARFGQSETLALVFPFSEMGLMMDPLEKLPKILKETCFVPKAVKKKGYVGGRGTFSSPRQVSKGGTFGQTEGSGQPRQLAPLQAGGQAAPAALSNEHNSSTASAR